jgi:CelD/BcsL family acetyltransferase involved in cellulose biosynthesis
VPRSRATRGEGRAGGGKSRTGSRPGTPRWEVGTVLGGDAIARVAPDWDLLADEVQAPPFLRPGWIAAWWRAFGRERLEIHTARSNGRLVAVLPLSRGRGVVASPTNWHTPLFGLVGEEAALPLLVSRVLVDASAARRVSLAFMDPSAMGARAFRTAALERGFRVLPHTLGRAAAVEIEGEWDAYEQRLSRNLKQGLKRSLRRLHEAGEVTFQHVDGQQGLDSLLTEGFRIEAAGWKGTRGTAIASDPKTERFYRDVGAWAAAEGWLRLAFLRLDERAIAFWLGIEDRGVHYALKSGFDPRYAAFSPGRLLLQRTLRDAFSRGLTRLELGPSEGYKLSWANASCELVRLNAFPPSIPGRLEWSVVRYADPAARRLLKAARSRQPRQRWRSRRP